MKFIMKRFTLIILMTVAAVMTMTGQSHVSPQDTCRQTLSISLLTCSQGKDISSAFGHSAIRVRDSEKGRDIVFNYGTFSFNEPHFLLNFLKGDLNYFLSISYFNEFKSAYERAGRGITEQPMNLTEDQKARIYSFLMENARPENKYYLYDFLQDNCATRIRDIFDRYGKDEFILTDTVTDMTYRSELDRLIGDRRWMMFGVDLLLGARVDRRITLRETEFLPDRLAGILATYRNQDMGGIPLMTSENTISGPAPGPGHFKKTLSRITSPFTVFTAIFLFYLLFFLRTGNKQRFTRIFSTVLYAILGTGGVILTLMWIATNHIWTAENWNLLWMNPLFLIPAVIREGRVKNIIITILTLISTVGLTASWLLPQTFHPAVCIIILLTILTAVTRRSVYSK